MSDRHTLKASELLGGSDPVERTLTSLARPGLVGVRKSRWSAFPTGGRKSKFGNVRTKVDGINFASKKEAARWKQLVLLETAGRIRNLERQKTYRLEVCGILVCRYIADFVYEEYDSGEWESVVEDSKGYKDRVYKLKAKLMKACHGIEIRET